MTNALEGQMSIWGDVGGKVGKNHPETSRTAAFTVKSGSQKAQIALALRNAYPEGMTGYELSNFIFNGAGRTISPNQTCTRLLELRESGHVEFMREFDRGPVVEKETTPGNTGQVNRLTGLGIRAAATIAN